MAIVTAEYVPAKHVIKNDLLQLKSFFLSYSLTNPKPKPKPNLKPRWNPNFKPRWHLQGKKLLLKSPLDSRPLERGTGEDEVVDSKTSA